MGIGAVNGYGFGDYSWYKPGTSGIIEDFDMALNAADDAAYIDEPEQTDDADGADELVQISPTQNAEVPDKTYVRVEPAEESERFWSDTMKGDKSTGRADMEQLHVAAMGFHTKRKFELLGL